jgi:carbamoyltransferase
VPPIPGDAGASVGAAYHFAGRSGVSQAQPFQHAFYCGLSPSLSEIQQALDSAPDIGYQPLPPADGPAGIARLADVLAYLIQQEAIIGLFQGQAETGPRALGHRSILANPCHAHTRQRLNQQVKYREPFRPLAPMLTLEAAQRWFQLSPGASADNFNAYNYMVLTAPARPSARQVIPAVIHHDGTGRLQIVRPSDSLTYAYLVALKRRIGVAVSVNTSLNVRSPIVQSPAQALDTLRRANALSGLVLVAESGEAFLAWPAVSQGLKDGGRQVRAWLAEWASQTANGAELSLR